MSLDFLREVPDFKGLVRALEAGERGIRISGVAAPAQAYFFSSLAIALPRPVVLVRPFDRNPADFEQECAFFFERLAPRKHARAFPALTESPYHAAKTPLDAVSARMRLFYDLAYRPPSLVVTNLAGLLRPFPTPEDLPRLFLRLEKDDPYERDDVLRTLEAYGYAREELISYRGEFAGRGGIVDVYSPWENVPCRIEFGSDGIVSIREFDPSTQKSIRKVDRVLVPSLLESTGPEAGSALFTRYFEDAVFIVDHPADVEREWDAFLDDLRAQERELRRTGREVPSVEELFAPPSWKPVRARAARFGDLEAEIPGATPGDPVPVEAAPAIDASAAAPAVRSFALPLQSVPRFENRIPFFLDYLRRLQRESERCHIYLSSPALRTKIATLLARSEIPAAEAESPLAEPRSGEILLHLGDLPRGFGCAREKIVFFAERDIITEEKVIVSRPSVRAALTQFQDLKAGDYVVHVDYGVGVFHGLLRMDFDGAGREFMELRYRDDDKLYVPVEDLSFVQKYSQVGPTLPPLDKLGSGSWQKTKERTKKAVESMARELLELYAQRKSLKGFRFSPEGDWQGEFEKTFEFEETEDQLRSIREIKNDMESEAPMDRLLCGDVGYGKTEVAMRAAFKAVMDGKQVAVLCPTTVLASQHFKTFASRLVLFPVRVAALTRLQSRAEQAQVVSGLAKGEIDIIIGTHRLLSADVAFRDLGLLVVDEEQRFGVKHKEKIKQMKTAVDVLTLTATPIPRTLNMSLSGLRDISLIETPPKDRLAVHTVVTAFQPNLVAGAIRQELARGGQVYYIFNKIEDMDSIAGLIHQWVPAARVVSVHGQMPPAELEKRMLDFVERRYDVLVSTTIIENGIDIPLVNTLIVHRADHFGLAQLYQLRGRVGRSSRQAFAYFLIPPTAGLTPTAERRLEALQEFSDLGSGFRLAMKDLEIRGAGNVFGARQHGTMEAVGFDYYIQLLEQTILELKGEAVEEVKSEIRLKADIRIPEDYLP